MASNPTVIVPGAARQHAKQHKNDRFQANLNCRYYVKIDGDTERAVFSEVNGLQMETEVIEYVEGGNNLFVYRLPGHTKAGNITLKRGVTKDNELFRWHTLIAQGVMDLRTVQVTMYATSGERLIAWSLQNAFPVKWVGPQLAANGQAVAIESIELAHSGILSVDF